MNPYRFGPSLCFRMVLGAAVGLVASAAVAQAAEPDPYGLRISGFGTLGAVHAAAPAGWGFRRSLEQPSNDQSTRTDVDSRLGIQANYALHAQLELVAQVLLARRAPSAPESDAIEWAFAAYRPTADLTIRAGRLNLDQFVMSDYRNVGFAYLYVRPPVEYYGTIPSNLDGADVTRGWTVDDVHWRAKGFFGRSETTGVPLTDVVGVALSRESGGLLLRAGWSRAKLARNVQRVTPLLQGLDQLRALPVPSVAADATGLRTVLDLAARPLTYATLSLRYEQALWQYATELTRIGIGSSSVRAGYASIGRRIGDFTAFAMISGASGASGAVAAPAWGALLTPAIGAAAAQQAQGLGTVSASLASQSIRQGTYSLGGRWDLHPRMALKLQWDHVKIRANGAYLWSRASGEAATAKVATVLLDFVF